MNHYDSNYAANLDRDDHESPLMPWKVNDGDEDYSYRWIVWAPDELTAIRLCIRRSDAPDIECLTASPAKIPEWIEPRYDRPYIEDDPDLLHDLGFMCEGDYSCDTCGLYEMDGLFPVCDGCHQCEDCGCDCSTDEETDE